MSVLGLACLLLRYVCMCVNVNVACLVSVFMLLILTEFSQRKLGSFMGCTLSTEKVRIELKFPLN